MLQFGKLSDLLDVFEDLLGFGLVACGSWALKVVFLAHVAVMRGLAAGPWTS